MRGTRLSGRALFRAVAPRLERAHRQRQAELLKLRRAIATQAAILHDVEWRVAHRELALARASATRRGPYIEKRHRLLAQAVTERDQAQARLEGARAALRSALHGR